MYTYCPWYKQRINKQPQNWAMRELRIRNSNPIHPDLLNACGIPKIPEPATTQLAILTDYRMIINKRIYQNNYRNNKE